MKDTLLSSQASHATRGTISRQPLGAPDQAYQTETRMSNPNPSPGQSHDHPDRQTASRRLDQVYQIRSPKSTPAHITSHHTKQPRNQSRPPDAASHPQAAHLTLPINNPQVKPGPKRLHTADTPYPWPTQRRKAKPHPHKTTQKPRTTPQGLGVHYTPLEEKQNRLDARRYCAPDMRLSLGGMVCPTICGDCWHHDTSHRDRLRYTPPCVGQLPTRQP